jgi:DNA/RNA-binding domain of Phe-tRNA-synthetase-like protein
MAVAPGPAAAGGQASSAAAGGQASPAAAGGQTSPAAAGGQTSPAAAGGQDSPAAAGGHDSPAAAGGRDSRAVDRYTAIAKSRLGTVTAESELPEIQAWRRAFAVLGLKPTQYRCASESLLRRFRKEGSLPRLHPLVDLCNAVSMAYAIPVAVLDLNAISGPLEVRYATGDEEYLTFAGDTEHPAPGEVIFADQAGQAHARRWTNRQSGRSAVRDTTSTALIVAEALHGSAPADVPDLLAALAGEIQALWATTPQTAILTAAAPRFTPHATTPHATTPHATTPHATTPHATDATDATTSGQRPDPQ